MANQEAQLVSYCNQIRTPTRHCPFCGALASTAEHYPQLLIERLLRDGYEDCQDDQDAWAYYVRCRCCGSEGGWSESELGAIEMWNMRTP